jgi:hypothetical protein
VAFAGLRARLAELGLERGEDAAENFVVAANTMLALHYRLIGQDGAALSKVEWLVSRYPWALQAAVALTTKYVKRMRIVDALRFAESALPLALEHGQDFMICCLEQSKVSAIMKGALGLTVTVGAAVRPLVEDARRRLEASKHWLTKPGYKVRHQYLHQLERCWPKARTSTHSQPFCLRLVSTGVNLGPRVSRRAAPSQTQRARGKASPREPNVLLVRLCTNRAQALRRMRKARRCGLLLQRRLPEGALARASR